MYMSGYGVCLAKLNRYEEADAPLREAYRLAKARAKVDVHRLRGIMSGLAEVCDHTNRPDEAAKWRAELAALQAATQPSTRPDLAPSTNPN
jgi:hypothetical protein